MKNIVPASYIIYKDILTIKAVNGTTNVIDYSGTNSAAVINNAINGLTVGRTWKEKVIIKGNYTINSTIKIPSYTSLDIQGRLTLGADVNLVESSSLTTQIKHVDISGGMLDGTGHSSYDGIYGLFSMSTISEMLIENFNNGIHLKGVDWGNNRPLETLVFNNNIGNNTINVFLDSYGADIEVVSNIIREWMTYGIQINGSGNRITGNHIWSSSIKGDASMYICTDGTGGSDINMIIGNSFSSRRDGLIIDAADGSNTIRYTIIANNLFRTIGYETNNTYDCIRFQRTGTPSIGHSVITGNKFWASGDKLPRYGINEMCYTNNCITGNSFSSMATAGIAPGDANTLIKNNKGFITEANKLSYTFAIDSTGIKTVTIAHSLDITPTVQDCYLTVVQNTTVDDWTYNMLKIVSTDAKNVTVKINVSTASATVGATAKLGLRVGNP